MSHPLVSVITPAYNRAAFLEETILSVLNQDYPNLEYIVLNDGSTDDSAGIIKRFTDRITCESHDNIGETRTVNKGLSMASGEIIGVVNSDDPLLPGALHAVVDLMRRREDVIVVYPDWYMIDGKSKKIEHMVTYEYDYIDMLRWHHCIPGPGAFFRKWIVDELEGRDPAFRYVADFDFWLRAGTLGEFCRIPRALATFRWHQGGISSAELGVRMAEEHLRLVNKIYSLPRLPQSAMAVRKEAHGSAYYVAGVVLGDASPKLKRRYFTKALALCPIKYVTEYRDRLINPILPTLFGPRVSLVFSRCAKLFPYNNKVRCPR